MGHFPERIERSSSLALVTKVVEYYYFLTGARGKGNSSSRKSIHKVRIDSVQSPLFIMTCPFGVSLTL